MRKNPARFRGIKLKDLFKARPGSLKGRRVFQYTWPGRLGSIDRFMVHEFIKPLARAKQAPAVRFLDAACAPGLKGSVTLLETRKAFEKAGARVEAHGVDSQTPKQVAGKTVYGVAYHKANILKDELPEGEFDVVRATNVLHYLKKPGKAFEKLASKLRLGGIMITTHYAPSAQLPWPKQEGTLNVFQKTPAGLKLVAVIPQNMKLASLEPPGKFRDEGERERWKRKVARYKELQAAYRAKKFKTLQIEREGVPFKYLREDPAARSEARKLFIQHHAG